MKHPPIIFKLLTRFIFAFECYDSAKGAAQSGICPSYFCVIRYVRTTGTIIFQGCVLGGDYIPMVQQCARIGDTVECYCNQERCNTIFVAGTQHAVPQITCFKNTPNECSGSVCSVSLLTDHTPHLYCDNTTESVVYTRYGGPYITASVTANSTTVPLINGRNYVNSSVRELRGDCYRDNCWNEDSHVRLLAMQAMIGSNRCYFDATPGEQGPSGPLYCWAHFCTISRFRNDDGSFRFERGCFFVEKPALAGGNAKWRIFIAEGIEQFLDRTTIYCWAQDCNESFDRAWTNIGNPYAEYLSSVAIYRSLTPLLFLSSNKLLQ